MNMHAIRLLKAFARASFQQELAYRSNFFISLFHSLLNLGTGVLALLVLFGQVQTIQGWDFPATLALLGVYLIVSSLRGLVFGPSLETMAGMDGEVWTGRLDYTLLRPVNTQFLASFRVWNLYALLDLALGLGVLVLAVVQTGQSVPAGQWVSFVLALAAAVGTLYAIMLAFSALVFWFPGVLFTWIFNSIFQMARYPVGLYPSWLRLVLTWIIPVGVITTLPAQALTLGLPLGLQLGGLAFSAALVLGASLLFRVALQRYASASS
jgi:ABC-2 type transport system permease protein